jgi:hypothetical protein
MAVSEATDPLADGSLPRRSVSVGVVLDPSMDRLTW